MLVDRPGKAEVTAAELEAALRAALASMSVKDAASAVSEALGLPRRDVYQAALGLAGEKSDGTS